MLLKFVKEQNKINIIHHTLLINNLQDKNQKFQEESEGYGSEEEEESESMDSDEAVDGIASSTLSPDTRVVSDDEPTSKQPSSRPGEQIAEPSARKIQPVTNVQLALKKRKTVASSAMKSLVGQSALTKKKSTAKSAGREAKGGNKDFMKQLMLERKDNDKKLKKALEKLDTKLKDKI